MHAPLQVDSQYIHGILLPGLAPLVSLASCLSLHARRDVRFPATTGGGAPPAQGTVIL
jgi:hypothetical protein